MEAQCESCWGANGDTALCGDSKGAPMLLGGNRGSPMPWGGTEGFSMQWGGNKRSQPNGVAPRGTDAMGSPQGVLSAMEWQ